jgi:ribokinase
MGNDLPKVVVVGSLHYDIMVDASGRPRKGETLPGRSWWPKCGGKGGNQAVAAASQGAHTRMIGAVGCDEFGRALLANLDARGVDRSGVVTVDAASSGMSVAIFDDDGDYGAVIVSGSNLHIAPEQVAVDRLAGARVLVLQNEASETINAAAAVSARELGAIVILNAAPARPFSSDLPDAVDVLVVNAVEAEMLGGGAVTTLDQALAAAKALTAQFRAVLVTAGGDGVAFADREGAEIRVPAVPVVVASTHGAGDAFVGTLAASLARGDEIRTAIETANKEAARIVSTPEADRHQRQDAPQRP